MTARIVGGKITTSGQEHLMLTSPDMLPRQPDALVVALVRHGRTAWNAQGRFLGRTDLPLDELGVAQAQALAERWAGSFDAVYSSPLARAHQTASALAERIRPEPRWMELHQGALEGMVAEEAMRAFPEFFAEWTIDPASARVPGGELLSECRDRSVRALEERMSQHSAGERVAVVSHQLVIAGLQCWILGEPLSRWRAHRIGNTAVVGIARGRSGEWSLVRPELPGGPGPTSV